MQVQFSTGIRRRMKPWQGVIFGLLFVIVGVGLGIFTANSISSYNEKDSAFVGTVAEVIQYKYNSEGLRAIVVEYEVDGNTYTKVSNSYSSSPKSIGTEVGIKYDPINPSDAIWSSDSTNVIMPIFAAIFTIAGVAVIVLAVKKMKNGEEYM